MSYFEGKINSSWIKYSDYTIVGDDMKFISPVKGSSSICYDIMNYNGNIIADALSAGREIFSCGGDSSKIDQICLNFVKKYGLLGFITFMPSTPEMILEDELYLGSNGDFFGSKTLKSKDYLNVFYPFSNKSKNKFSIITGCDPIMDYAFDKNYCELSLWIAANFMKMYKTFKEFLNTDKNKKLSTNKIFENRGFTFKLKGPKNPQMIWQPSSLNTMLLMFLSDSLSDESKPLKICKHCNAIFYSKNRRSEFCSPRCRNQFNVYKSRRKH